ncbi:transmembrane protein C1orf162 homolog isoform X1 [Hippopotamus amphibius kiboko]|uniref:transmembrane protein C1orf162 homolog isoform X1 n=1 Tax=Hippopotamus amphibius kiboko TaxID=575201 RepID=UPI0025999D67|nr:transmembrane protein C1orf162 homolog isoform X1 [Hippopotamus amphibius kiboko]
MGNDHSKPEPDNNRQRIHSMAAPAVTCAPCLSGHLNKEHLVLAFFAGVLLTLLLMALVLLITKSCRKCHSSPRALDPHSDPPATVRRHSSPQALDPHSDPPATVRRPRCFLDVEACCQWNFLLLTRVVLLLWTLGKGFFEGLF